MVGDVTVRAGEHMVWKFWIRNESLRSISLQAPSGGCLYFIRGYIPAWSFWLNYRRTPSFKMTFLDLEIVGCAEVNFSQVFSSISDSESWWNFGFWAAILNEYGQILRCVRGKPILKWEKVKGQPYSWDGERGVIRSELGRFGGCGRSHHAIFASSD